MKYYLYSIRDKYRSFMQPMMDTSKEAAKRGFGVAINNGPQELGYAPSDFDLYKVGEFDSDSGEIKAVTPIEFICNGMEVFDEKS